MNITNERLAEILNQPDIAGETELEALAREVRELRESHSVACETCDGLRDTITKVRAETMTLTRDRDELRKERDRLRMVVLRGDGGDEIEQLTRERDEASRTIDLQSRQIAHQARQCQEIEDELAASNIVRDKLTEENKRLLLELRAEDTAKIELAEARELLRRFRELFPDKWQIREVDDFATVVKYQASACCRDYDTRFGQQPEPAGELVPWTAETRPRGPMTLRRRDRHWYEFTPAWEMDGDASGEYQISWKELCVEYEWSRDGVNWERCGTEVPK